MEEILSSETSVLTRVTRRHILEDGILHSLCREHTLHSINTYITYYIALTGWTLWRIRNMFPARYEPGFYIPEDGILHIHRSENLKSDMESSGSRLNVAKSFY
jgi:hypothetical protein